jgi:hypothetical protein
LVALLGGARPTSTAAAQAACSPRPPVGVSVVPGTGRLQATITAGLSSQAPNNRLREIRFGAASNAVVDVRDRVGAPGGFSLPLTDRPQSVSFAVRRAVPSGGATVPLVAVDDCGEWPTFVGERVFRERGIRPDEQATTDREVRNQPGIFATIKRVSVGAA